MTTGYCENCGQNVLATRERMDTCLAIILLIFTAGIGFFIYLIIHYSKEPNRCIHCSSIIQLTLPKRYSQSREQLPYQQQARPPQKYALNEDIIQVQEEGAKFCPLCGEKLDNRKDKFCQNCGSRL